MGKTKSFLCVASFIAFIVLSVDQTYKNQEIQSRTPQEQQASVQRAKTKINSAFNGLEKRLEPLVECIVDGGVESNQQHDKTCKNSTAILSLLNAILNLGERR